MTPEPPAPPAPSSDRYGIILAALGGVLVALVLAVVVIVLARKDDGGAATTSTASTTSVSETTLAENTTTLSSTTAETTTASAAPTTTAPAPTTTLAPFAGDLTDKSGPIQGTPTGRVIDIRHGEHPGYTRVVFDFSPGGVPGYYISYSSPTTLSVLLVSMDTATPYAPGVFDASGEHPIGTISVGSVFSGGMGGGSGEWEFPIETSGAKPFSVGTLSDPPRLYIDIAD